MLEIGLLDYLEKQWNDISEPFYFTVNFYDIPNTVAAAIRNLPSNCRKINVVRAHSDIKNQVIIDAANERNIEIVWVPGKVIMEELECQSI